MKREPRPVAAPQRESLCPEPADSARGGSRRRGSPVDRRTFLGHLGIGAGAAAGLTASASTLLAQSAKDPEAVQGIVPIRQARAFEVRMRAAELARKRRHIPQAANGDENLYPNRIGSYSKGLPHNNLGEVDPAAYNAFLACLATADPAEFERLPMGLTILKAWFDPSFVLPRPVVPDASGTSLLAYTGVPLTVGNELDKLAANVGVGRNGAGFHYRSDYWQSLLLGEQLAIGILEEQRETYRELCTFSFRGFEGQTITV